MKLKKKYSQHLQKIILKDGSVILIRRVDFKKIVQL